ncbi:MAG: RDD family protein [Proteobacteria bacterium]|nr:RDD family protein [Pseudomonadota bacterium]
MNATMPARFAHRCAAWSLDAVVPGLATMALCWPRLSAGATRMTQALDQLSAALARAMDAMMMGTLTPLELTRAWVADPAQRAAVEALSDAIGALLMPPLLVFPLLALAWFVGFEASSRQATPGKRLLGLRVVDVDGRGIGLLRAVQRHLAGTLSWLTLNIGHLLAALPPQRLALHDRIAGTRVVQVAGTGALPGWARAWLGLLAVASVGALAWLFVVASAAMQRAFEAMLY